MNQPIDQEIIKRQWTRPTVYSIIIIALLIAVSWVLTTFIGDECWFQRFGALAVGIGIAVEAFALFEPGRILVGWGAVGTDPIKMKTAIVCALLGTILWAFGDLIFRQFGYCAL